MSEMSIVTKAWLLMGLLVMGLLVLIGVSERTERTVVQTNEDISARAFPFQLGAVELRLNVIQIQQWLQDISATRALDGLDDGFSKAEEQHGKAMQQLDQLGVMDAEHAADYRQLHADLDAYYDIGKRMARAYVDQGPAGGNPMMGEFDTAAERLMGKVDDVLTRSTQENAEMLAQQMDAANAGRRNILITALVIGIVLLGGMLMLIRTVQPLAELTTAALRIADNDLTGKVPQLDRRDEVGQLAAAVTAMQEKLVRRVKEIAAVTQQVRHAAETLNAVSDHTNSGVQQQRSETQQVASAMHEMTATVHEVARNTAAAAEAASHADEEVGGGSKVVKQTIASISKLADEVRKGVEVISRLEQDSNTIGAVLDVIKSIAEQTNLLALNAAIEAARAGEQGRGFAVVADEVRTLAQRTQVSTREIQQMIEKLQQGAQEAVRVMHEGRSQAEVSVNQAGQAGRSLDTIRSAVSTIHDMTTQIASAAEEQSAVAEEINRNIVNIGHVVDQASSGMEETAGASDELNRLAEQLQAVVMQFKLPA